MINLDDRAKAVRLSYPLTMRLAKLIERGAYTATAQEIIHRAEQQNISVDDAYLQMNAELDQQEANYKATTQQALEAYDIHISNHADELAQLHKQLSEARSIATTVSNQIKNAKNARDGIYWELRRADLSNEQIKAVIEMKAPFDFDKAEQEVYQAKRITMPQLQARIDDIYSEAKAVQLNVIVGI
ncbi:hypothetical protein MKI79_06835 [Acinetobacter sp. A3.8]|uniref:Uncharacterized protein n=1 Tax=Acinetobacter sedimenti TaxID=2919922 RepID=A0A9X2B708_9GAMM|nr:hypothetical protein [Acinetobacter sedimenti]MCJ8146617.1 hypothetical protein [Acinetobacter sedimenti]